MPVEIERKFLVDRTLWSSIKKPEPDHLRQGYLVNQPGKTIRVRVTDSDAFITIKGSSKGALRSEYEYEIPKKDAEELLDQFSESVVEKKRFRIHYQHHTWEVDEFLGKNKGLLLAEIELTSEEEKFERPDWVTREVTNDQRYYNAHLAQTPYEVWDTQ